MDRTPRTPALRLATTPPGLTPDGLAACHPRWAGEVDQAGPWQRHTGGSWRAGAPGDVDVVVCGPCGSALDEAWQRVELGRIAPGGAVLAVSQSAGRGQRGRRWYSPPGNLYAAWCWPVPAGSLPPTLVPLAAAWLVVEALEALGVELAIKWPNDLLWQERKVGGILVEARGDRQVVGLGLNLEGAPPYGQHVTPDALPPGVLPLPGAIGPVGLWRRIAAGALGRVAAAGAAGVVAAVAARLAWRGEAVVVSDRGAGEQRGVVAGLAPDGGLRLHTALGPCTLHTGTVRRGA